MDQHIEAADDRRSESGDSGYDESMISTASLSSSMYEYEKQHGRTYHAEHALDHKYALPNDESEQERLDIQYHGYRLAMGNKMFVAPMENPTAVVDIGTGTGCMDMADAYPAAEVVGVDISPIQPRWVPPNLTFEVFDAEQPWTFADNRFSMVHTRIMNGFSLRNWPNFFANAFRTLKPGGWVENQEFDLAVYSDDNTIPEDSALQKWVRYFEEGLKKVGMTGRLVPQVLEQQMKEAGFINTKVIRFKGPLGPWPKDKALREAGIYNLVAMLEGIEGISARIFMEALGWTQEELTVFLSGVRTEMRKRNIHSYWPGFIFIGQKPV